MTDLSRVQYTAGALQDNIARVIVGKAQAVELLLAALLTQGHVLIEDVPISSRRTSPSPARATIRA